MSLSAYVAEKRKLLYGDLLEGLPPREGEYDGAVLASGRTKEPPQYGSTRYEPHAVLLEFIYPSSGGAAEILTIRLATPERIVFLPVPPWVVESIWQGEVDGTYHFESDARNLLEEIRGELDAATNLRWFGPRQPKHRD